jgi:hypothetical protein
MKPTDTPPLDPMDPMDAWLAGDLTPDSETERVLLAASTDTPSLSDELAAHREIRARVRSLEAEVSPERDLWPGIAARIGAPHGTGTASGHSFWRRPVSVPRWAAVAALLAAIVGTGVLLREQRAEDAARLVVAATPAPSPVMLDAYAKTNRQLDAVRDELWRSIEASQGKLPPQTRAVVFENLRTIERALDEIEAALAESPADAELARTYIAYRERQIALLRQANQLAARL